MVDRLSALVKKEFIQIRRDRRTLGISLIVPVLWLILFGYAATFDVKNIPIAVQDQADNARSRELVVGLQATDRFTFATPVTDRQDLEDRIKRGDIVVGLIIPKGFGEVSAASSGGGAGTGGGGGSAGDGATGGSAGSGSSAVGSGTNAPQAPVEILMDGSQLFSATTAIRFLQAEAAKVQAEAIQAAFEQAAKTPTIQVPPATPTAVAGVIQQILAQFRPALPAAPPAPKIETLYNPDLSSVNFMIPALLGMVVMFMTTFLTAMAIVRERENGTLEQIAITPIRSVELMLGKIIPYAIIGLVDFWLVLAAAVYIFKIPFVGNVWIFFALALFFEAATLSVGLLISTIAQNQPQAMQMAILYMFPQFALSGLIFPLSAMPSWLRWVSVAFPLTFFAPISRGMFLKGIGLEILWPQALALVGFALFLVVLASVQFRRRLG